MNILHFKKGSIELKENEKQTKRCAKCKEDKSTHQFWSNRRTKDGYYSWCKTCSTQDRKDWHANRSSEQKEKMNARRRAYLSKNEDHRRKITKKYIFKYDLKKKYNLSVEQYEQMCKDHNHVCAICNKPEPRKNGRLCVDHNHKTDKVRGLLCSKCNAGLGLFKDNPKLLLKAIEYLNPAGVVSFHYDIRDHKYDGNIATWYGRITYPKGQKRIEYLAMNIGVQEIKDVKNKENK